MRLADRPLADGYLPYRPYLPYPPTSIICPISLIRPIHQPALFALSALSALFSNQHYLPYQPYPPYSPTSIICPISLIRPIYQPALFALSALSVLSSRQGVRLARLADTLRFATFQAAIYAQWQCKKPCFVNQNTAFHIALKIVSPCRKASIGHYAHLSLFMIKSR